MKLILPLGVLLSIFFSLPSIAIYLGGDKYSPALLSDWDESYYLELPDKSADVPIASFVTLTDGTLSAYEVISHSVVHVVPHVLVDVILGKALRLLELRPVELGILLDLACFFASFLVLFLTFRRLAKDNSSAFTSALVTLTLPWIFALSGAIDLRLWLPENILVHSHNFFPSLPVLRSIYTQVSYPLFFLVLGITSARLMSGSIKWRSMILLGGLSGALIYVYLFAWVSIVCIVFTMLVINQILNPKNRGLKRFAADVSSYFASMLAVAAFGISLLFGGNRNFTPGPDDIDLQLQLARIFSKYIYLSPIICIALLVVLYLGVQAKRAIEMHAQNGIDSNGQDRSRFVLLIMVGACLASELILMNIQPLLGRWITSYHFPLFYLHPVLAGSGVLLILHFFRDRWMRNVVMLGLISLSSVGTFTNVVAVFANSRPDSVSSLMSYIDSELPPQSSIAAVPFAKASGTSGEVAVLQTFPYWITVFTRAEAFPQLVSVGPEREHLIRAELLASWLFTGNLDLIGPCPSSFDTISEQSIAAGLGFFQVLRKFDCALLPIILSKTTVCDLLREFRVDYLVLESGLGFSDYACQQRFSNIVWQSNKAEFTLIKFDQAGAIGEYCK